MAVRSDRDIAVALKKGDGPFTSECPRRPTGVLGGFWMPLRFEHA
jgi:hypothetical protein